MDISKVDDLILVAGIGLLAFGAYRAVRVVSDVISHTAAAVVELHNDMERRAWEVVQAAPDLSITGAMRELVESQRSIYAPEQLPKPSELWRYYQ